MTQYSAKKLTKALYQLMQRRLESLRLYEPLEYLARFHEDDIPEKTCRGGNRCLAGESLVYDPVVERYSRVDSIDGSFHVNAVDPNTGKVVVAEAEQPFVKGVEIIWEYRLSNGQCLLSTPNHRVLDQNGVWIRLADAFVRGIPLFSAFHLQSNVASSRSILHANVQSSQRTASGSRCGCLVCCDLRDGQLLQDRDISRLPVPSQVGVQEYTSCVFLTENDLETRSKRNRLCRQSDLLSNFRGVGESEDLVSFCEGFCGNQALRSCSATGNENVYTVLEPTTFRQRTGISEDRGRCLAEDFEFYSSHPSKFEVGTEHDTITIISAMPIRQGTIWDFTVPKYANYVHCTLVNCNSGKTTICAVEVARAVTGQDPFNKYPTENGRAYLVAKDGKQVAEVMYRKLFRSGAFKMIKDENTHLWRLFKPWEERDVRRLAEVKLAPPLIPQRFIAEHAWENKAQQVPNIIRLKNGWELSFYPSGAKPPRGVDIDLVWFDEEIIDPEWYTEMSARLIDRNGRFLWSATPQTGSEQLYDLSLKSADQEHMEKPNVREYYCDFAANPHLTDAQKELFADKLPTDEERRVRIGGEFAVLSFKVYPEFSKVTHAIDPFEIPLDWTRYMIVDPGRQVCAVLFAAVPPPKHELADHTIFYDECYIKNCSAQKFGDTIAKKMQGQFFWDFIIDSHGSRVADVGAGRTVEDQYCEALRDHSLHSHLRGHSFLWGNDDLEGGLEAARSWLLIGDQGQPRLKVFKTLENFMWEAERYKYIRQKGLLTDKPEKRNDHLMDCFRYIALYDPQHHYQPRSAMAPHGALASFRAKQKRMAGKDGVQGGVSLGPSSRVDILHLG